MTTRADIAAEAKSWIGTPWQHQGRMKGRGVDCAGVIIEVGNNLGLMNNFKLTAYSRQPDGFKLKRLCDQVFDLQEGTTNLRDGNIVLMRFHRMPIHMGIIVDDGKRMVHGHYDDEGVVIHRLTDDWRRRIVAVYDYKGVEDG